MADVANLLATMADMLIQVADGIDQIANEPIETSRSQDWIDGYRAGMGTTAEALRAIAKRVGGK